MAAQERHNVDRKASLAAQDKLARDYEAATKRALEAEALAARRVDVDNLDEAAFFRLAEQKNIQPQRLGEWIRNAMTNPERVAEAAALSATRSTYDPKLAALEAQIAELRAQNQSFLDRHNEAQAAVQEREQTHAFLGMVSQSADRAPLAARLLAADQNEFMQIAELAARNVPGQGPQALLDAVEEMLDQDGRQVAQTYAALYGFTSQAQAPKTQNRAAAMANTVSNSLAQERASLVEEEDYARLPIEERAARLIRSMK